MASPARGAGSVGSGTVPVVRAAVAQLTSGADRDTNLAVAAELVGTAAADGAELVVLPELVGALGPGSVLRSSVEPFDGPSLAWARDVAAAHGVWLVAGSFLAEAPEDPEGRTHNTSCLLSPDGALVAAYRKIHLFDVDVPGATFRESSTMAPGAEVVVADAGPLRLGMSICYDLRFPEVFRIQALRGATAVTLPSAFTATTGPPHWEVLLRARAIEDQCFVLASAQVGTTEPDLAWHGHAMIVDPWGRILAEAPGPEDPSPTLAAAELDLDELAAIRQRLPSLANRRPSAYTWEAPTPDPAGRRGDEDGTPTAGADDRRRGDET